ncbi:uncharacterized protein LOC135949819 [Calliphora vicina]|uniref:uncharacterized protein LOC135949819 n=1 Tax=Calliphora vicina TaxID=7373 RepID=UPI00325BB0AF
MSAILATARQTVFISNLLKKPLNNIIIDLLKLNKNLSSSCSSKNDMENKKNYKTPHPPKDPPDNYNPSCVDHEALETPDFIPPAVFRQFTSTCEILGPGADKKGCYKNPEYYSYHRYSFAALQQTCLAIRAKKDDNIRCLYDYEQSDDETYSSDEDKK